MKNKKVHIFIALLISLLIYLFYRTDNILITHFFSIILTETTFNTVQNYIMNQIPLPSWVIYSLPEGLWIYATTIASKNYFIKLKSFKINLVFLPLIIAFTIELFQFIQISNGTFDELDLIIALFFSFLGYFLPFGSSLGQTRFHLSKLNDFLCLTSYLIVFLAHSSV